LDTLTDAAANADTERDGHTLNDGDVLGDHDALDDGTATSDTASTSGPLGSQYTDAALRAVAKVRFRHPENDGNTSMLDVKKAFVGDAATFSVWLELPIVTCSATGS
jgi:hypothetical protein